MDRIKLINIFKSIYAGDKDSLDLALLELRKNHASQLDCVSILREVLSLSLKEADKIVVDSSIWRDRKLETEQMRVSFNQTFFEASSNRDGPEEFLVWEEERERPCLFQRIFKKIIP